MGKKTIASLILATLFNAGAGGAEAGQPNPGLKSRSEMLNSLNDFLNGKEHEITVNSKDKMLLILKLVSEKHDLDGEKCAFVVEEKDGMYKIINLTKNGGRFLYDPENKYSYVINGRSLVGGIVDDNRKVREPVTDIINGDFDGFNDIYSPIPAGPSLLSQIDRYSSFQEIIVISGKHAYKIEVDYKLFEKRNKDEGEYEKLIGEWKRKLIEHIRKASEQFLKDHGYMPYAPIQMSAVLAKDVRGLLELFNEMFEKYGVKLTPIKIPDTANSPKN